jgi:trigger factor
LNITTESLPNRQVNLVIAMDEKETRQAMQRAARNISKQVNIPGFRKGKAPYDRILQQFGEDTIRQEAAEVLVEEVYEKALEQEGIEPYTPADLDKVDLEPTITFTFTVPLRPIVKLGDYDGYRLKYKEPKVSKKDVQEALENIRLQNAILELADRPVAMGDGAVVSILAKIGDERVIDGDRIHVLVEADSVYPAPGFAQAIEGMAAGDERTFSLALPDDFPREPMRGQEAEFSVKMIEVYDQTIPDLDDDLARTVGKFDSLKELERQVKDRLLHTAKREVEQGYAEQVLKDLVEQAQIEYPPVLLERELDATVAEVERRVKQETKLSLDDYLRFQNKTMETLREELTEAAETRLEQALFLGEVAKQEGFEATEAELQAQVEAMSAPWGVRADEMRRSLNSEKGQRALRNRMLTDKAMLKLTLIAKGEADKADEPEEEPANEESKEEA